MLWVFAIDAFYFLDWLVVVLVLVAIGFMIVRLFDLSLWIFCCFG